MGYIRWEQKILNIQKKPQTCPLGLRYMDIAYRRTVRHHFTREKNVQYLRF
jgi:hypothetical protein